MKKLLLLSFLLLSFPAQAQQQTPPPDAVVLFNVTDSKDTTWKAHWKHATEFNGVLLAGAETKESYQDFQLYAEFCVHVNPKFFKASRQVQGNSGIYLQGRYEIQIANSFGATDLTDNDNGALYKTRKPDVNASKREGEWQSFDITFRAARFDAAGKKTENARITVVHNGVTIHRDAELPNKTGGGAVEGPQPGPIQFQGHSNPVLFRNIWIVKK